MRFGEATAQVMGGNATGLTVTVPDVPEAASGQEVKVVVQTRGGRSKPLGFKLNRTPKVAALDPEAALPGQTVTMRGQSLAGAVTVTVGGAAARVVEAKGDVIRFQVPNLPPTPARTEPVIVQIGDRASSAVDLLIGKLPVILDVVPPRGDAGDRVGLRGKGFAAAPEGNKVTFAGASALVLSATSSELQVAVPLAPAGATDAEIVVEASGRPTTNRAVFTYTSPSTRLLPSPLRGDRRGLDAGPGLRLESARAAPRALVEGRREERAGPGGRSGRRAQRRLRRERLGLRGEGRRRRRGRPTRGLVEGHRRRRRRLRSAPRGERAQLRAPRPPRWPPIGRPCSPTTRRSSSRASGRCGCWPPRRAGAPSWTSSRSSVGGPEPR